MNPQVFANDHLVVDLGSLHGSQQASVVFSRQNAAVYGLTLGRVYNLDIFHAERHSQGASR